MGVLHDDFDVSGADKEFLQVAGYLGAGHRQPARHKDGQHYKTHALAKNRGCRGPAHVAPNGMVGGRLLLAANKIVINRMQHLLFTPDGAI